MTQKKHDVHFSDSGNYEHFIQKMNLERSMKRWYMYIGTGRQKWSYNKKIEDGNGCKSLLSSYD